MLFIDKMKGIFDDDQNGPTVTKLPKVKFQSQFKL